MTFIDGNWIYLLVRKQKDLKQDKKKQPKERITFAVWYKALVGSCSICPFHVLFKRKGAYLKKKLLRLGR